MGEKIEIMIGTVICEAELFDTACAKAITDILPIQAAPEEWGDEFYFEIPLALPLDETATTDVTIGDIGYWPPGNALAIFFGPTPLSTGMNPVPASKVNHVGKIVGDARVLKKAKGSKKISLRKIL